MDFNLQENLQYCADYVAEYSGLLLYSHIPTAIITLLIGLFVFFKGGRSILSKILLSLSVVFSLWVISDLIIWLGYAQSSLVMAIWAPIEIYSVLLFVLCLYFVYVFINKKDAPLWSKVVFSTVLLTLALVTPTEFNLQYFDLQECYAVENESYIKYFSALKLAIAGLTVLYLIYGYIRNKSTDIRKQILILGAGIAAFLFTFTVSGYIANTTENYKLEMYGLFAIVIFMSALAYLIVEFKTFNVKVFGAQALVVALVILIGSQFAFVRSTVNQILTAISLLITIFLGINLIRSVRKEIEVREQLQVANEGQENLIHIMNHQIKGYLTKARNIFAELKSEPDYCAGEAAKPMLDEGFKSLTEGVEFVQQVLQGSSASSGKLVYNLLPQDFNKLVSETAEKQRGNAQAKNLSFEVKTSAEPISIKADDIQLKEAVRNLIDNSIRYTQAGGLTITTEKSGNKALLKVVDTGVGISTEDKQKLFQKGGRGKDSLKYNVNSTGYGLAFVKGVVEAHGGRVWAESAGTGKGSTFYLELPLA